MFAPEHDFDAATQLFVTQVATPMEKGVGAKVPPIGAKQKFSLRTFLGEEATKAHLLKIYRGDLDDGPPALLFSGGAWYGFQFWRSRAVGYAGRSRAC